MVQAGHRTGFWRSVRELPERMSLRVKLTTAVLALVAIALVVISVASASFIRSYLLGQADDQIGTLENQAQNFSGHFFANRYGPERYVYEFVTSTGTVTVVGGNLPPGNPGPQVTSGAPWLTAAKGQAVTVGAQAGAARWRVAAFPNWSLTNANGSTVGTLVVGLDVSSDYATIGTLTSIDLIVSLLILLCLVLVSAAVVRASLRPLTDIERTAGAIAAGDLSRRVPERDPRTEVGRLGRSLNVMLSQIESAFHARSRSEEAARRSEGKMRQFVADASHELRTPLTAIRGFAEYYRQRGGIDTGGNGPGHLAPADLDRIMRRVEQESARMGILVEDMLLLARLDQQRPLEAKPVDLLTLAADAVHDARVVAPSRNINLTVGSGAALLVIGDEVRLRQVIGNLMSNALSHTPDGTPIDVLIRSGNLDEAPATPPPPPPPGEHGDSDFSSGPHADVEAPSRITTEPAERLHGEAAVLEVTDHGPGLTRNQAEHVFERFYRADQARSSGGTGLGLAIVAALVAAHGGTAWVHSRPGEGATFSIALPLSPEAVQGSHDDFGADAEDSTDDAGNAQEPPWLDSGSGNHARAAVLPDYGVT
jgi:two-component system OmpR family sensor kinase